MKKLTMKPYAYILVLLVVGLFGVARAGKPKGHAAMTDGIKGTLTNDLYSTILINNVFDYYGNNGDGSFNPYSADNEGFEYPKGTSGHVIFEQGIVWGGYVMKNPDITQDSIAVGGSTYWHGLQAGRILTAGTHSVAPNADDPSLAGYRIYRIRPDVNPSTPLDANLQTLLQNEEVSLISRYQSVTATTLYNQYIADWNNWPAAEGAPYTDAHGVTHYDGSGTYNPATCTPGIPGAAQTLWYVANDMNSTRTTTLAGSLPIGLEMQRTIWAYARTGALGSSVFESTKLINKSGYDVDSMFIVQWADPDLGGSLGYNFNYVGCDTARNLGFVYQGIPIDPFYGKAVPSGGFRIFQGPWIKTGNPSDSAVFDLKYRYGYKNLGMSGFNFFSNGNATYSDPANGTYNGTLEWYNLMNGLVSTSGASFTNPITNQTSKLLLSGDPVTGQGWLDGLLVGPGDRRMCLTTGPINFANGDTQEIVDVNLAGQSTDRYSSISLMKFYSDLDQSAYNDLFKLPPAPPTPKVTVTAGNNEIILNWTDSLTNAEDENQDTLGFKFEGYNVYQYPANSTANGQLIATYDKVDLITKVFDDVFDPITGAVVYEPVQFGGDFGIAHFIDLKTDAFQSFGANFVNGQTYYFAVTAYNYNGTPGLVGNNLESPPQIIAITPHGPALGVRNASKAGQSITAVHSAGVADASLLVNIVDPSRLTGDQYKVTVTETDSVFNANAGVNFPNPRWTLTDVTKNKAVLSRSTVYESAISKADPVVDGLQVAINGAPFWVPGFEIGSISYVPSADSNLAAANPGDFAFMGGGLGVADAFGFGSELNPWNITMSVQIKFVAQGTGQNAYDFVRQVGGSSGGAPYSGFFPQPFTVWDISNPASPKQIDFAFMELSGDSYQNDIWAPGATAGDREYMFIIDTAYTAAAKPVYTGSTLAALLPKMPVAYEGWFVLNNTANPAYKPGDVWTINAVHTITTNDQFTFSTSGLQPKFSSTLQATDVGEINVFPNPYFGFNAAEVNRYNRFVTFNHLPTRATIKIYNLSGLLVRTIVKNDPTQFAQWDLSNGSGLPAAAGVYVAYIDLPDLGKTRELKLAIIPETQYLDRP